MADVEQIAKTTLEEIERLLNTKTVVGEPISVEGATLIPLVSFGFAFGAGGGSGKAADKGEGGGSGTGGGGGIKPVAIIVITKDGVKVEPIKRGTGRVLERIVDTIAKARAKKSEEQSESPGD